MWYTFPLIMNLVLNSSTGMIDRVYMSKQLCDEVANHTVVYDPQDKVCLAYHNAKAMPEFGDTYEIYDGQDIPINGVDERY